MIEVKYTQVLLRLFIMKRGNYNIGFNVLAGFVIVMVF
jgi:hypothetical protein